MLNLAQLKKALEPIKSLTRAESSIVLSGVEIFVRVLTPEQDFAVQKESQFVLEEIQEVMEGGDRVKLLAYLDEFRLQTLTRCIVQIGDLDLRDVTHIETGELLENGTPIKVSKEKALKEILSEWNRPMQISILDCYNALVEKIEKETNTSVKGDFADESSEITYLKSRLAELEESQSTKQLQKEQDVRSTFRSVVETSKAKQTEEQRTKDASDYLKEKKVQQEKVQQQQQEAPPSKPETNQTSAETPISRQPIFPTQSTPPQQVQQTQSKPQTQTPPLSPQTTSSPNEDSVFFQEQEFPPQKQETLDGIEVYRLPTQTLGEEIVSPNKTQVQPTSRNPRFITPNQS